MSKLYITTAIPYVNASPHIGFALELIQTDCFARWRRQQGWQVRFVTGADENSLKNVQAAEKAGMEVRAFVDKNTGRFQELKTLLNLDYQDFIRTVEERHFRGAQKLWGSCRLEDIYKKKYKGLYCVGCEMFYMEDELTPEGLCPEHKTKPESIEEENYFFKLSNYQNQLLDLIERNEFEIIPATRRNEVIQFIKSGLADFSISRSVERARGWGVPVPDDETQVMYVWFDALSNYINAIDYAQESSEFFDAWWNFASDIVHVIGKGIIRFHAVYWPAMLLSAGVKLPKTLFVHGYIHSGGEKMSKTLGNVIDPFEIVQRFGADATRYFLLSQIPSYGDGDFTIERITAVYNAALANDLGNLVGRVLTMVDKYLEGQVRKVDPLNNLDAIDTYMEQFQFDAALQEIWSEIRWANKFIDEKKPWVLAKEDGEELREVLESLVASLRQIGDRLTPFMPDTADKINTLLLGDSLHAPEKPLFPRIETISSL